MTAPIKTAAMTTGRHADTTRRRERVLTALHDSAERGEEISVSGIARRAAVDRTFLYRHPDLLEQIHVAETQPPKNVYTATTVSRASLHADLLAAHDRAVRLTTRVQQLEQRLSRTLGETAWQETGLGAPTDIDQLNTKITNLEQQILELRLQLEERTQDLDAARAANRDLITRLNSPSSHR